MLGFFCCGSCSRCLSSGLKKTSCLLVASGSEGSVALSYGRVAIPSRLRTMGIVSAGWTKK